MFTNLHHLYHRLEDVYKRQDLNVLGQIIAYDTDIDEGEYQRLRGKAIRDMKRTNGRISFKDALDFQKSV